MWMAHEFTAMVMSLMLEGAKQDLAQVKIYMVAGGKARATDGMAHKADGLRICYWMRNRQNCWMSRVG